MYKFLEWQITNSHQVEIENLNSPVLRVHKTILRLDASPEELKELRKLLYSGLYFITAKVK